MNVLPLMDANSTNPLESSIARLRADARDYYALCDEADALGIPTSLDDPDSPATIAALKDAVAQAER